VTPGSLLVPLDGSRLAERAMHVASPLAARFGAGLELLTTEWPDDSRSPEDYLDCVAGFLGRAAPTTVVDPERHAVEAIEHVVHEHPGTLVCMTTHGRGRFRWAALGSIAETVIRDASAPLLLVGPHGEPTWDRDPGGVVVCVDGSPAALPEVIEACRWAEMLGLGLTIAYVDHPLDIDGHRTVGQMLAPLEEAAQLRGIAVTTRTIISSSVAGALADFADDSGATLLVMGAHGRRGLARFALGSVTMGVVNAATCPVLVLPPKLG
jgi:nucleotide-binding universal stress UspA family protein